MFLFSLLAACGSEPTPVAEPEPVTPAVEKSFDDALRAKAAIFGALPSDAGTPKNPTASVRVDLGRMLFYDKRLSMDDTVSCNDCHFLDKYGVDGTATSTGIDGQVGGRNAPTVYNAALHSSQFWDGREPDVEAQAKGPVLNPIEMGMPDGDAVVAKLSAIDGYTKAFAAAFSDDDPALTYDNMGLAIGAFERTLLTPGPFDAWMKGDDAAMNDAQKEGLNTFVDAGCAACHIGPAFGGTMFQKLGLVAAYDDGDMGRKEVTGLDADKQVFKVPSLRNIAQTGPYFHNGKVATLGAAVHLMGTHQLGKDLSDTEVGQIETFLGALTGPLPMAHIAKPTLP